MMIFQRINWKLAVVERLITGLDGVTRAAEIKTAGGKTNQPITRLFLLEINESNDQGEQAPKTSSTDTKGKVTGPVLCQTCKEGYHCSMQKVERVNRCATHGPGECHGLIELNT